MKIKLTRDLWNHKANETIEAGNDRGTWAVNKGYAVEIPNDKPDKQTLTSDQAQNITVTMDGRKLASVLNKAIEPNYKRNKNI